MNLKPKARLILVGTLIVAAQVACAAPSDEPSQSPPYRVSGAGGEAQLFAEGIISSVLPEFATTFSPNGYTVYFSRPRRSRLIPPSTPSAGKKNMLM